MNAKRRGTRNEHRSIVLLEASGYSRVYMDRPGFPDTGKAFRRTGLIRSHSLL